MHPENSCNSLQNLFGTNDPYALYIIHLPNSQRQKRKLFSWMKPSLVAQPLFAKLKSQNHFLAFSSSSRRAFFWRVTKLPPIFHSFSAMFLLLRGIIRDIKTSPSSIPPKSLILILNRSSLYKSSTFNQFCFAPIFFTSKRLNRLSFIPCKNTNSSLVKLSSVKK